MSVSLGQPWMTLGGWAFSHWGIRGLECPPLPWLMTEALSLERVKTVSGNGLPQTQLRAKIQEPLLQKDEINRVPEV